MKQINRPRAWIRTLVAMVIVAGVVCGWATALRAADPKPDASTNAPAKVSAAKPAAKPAKKAAKPLTGAELYAMNCNRCHPERYPTEFNSAQWKTLVTHMRVRANLPAKTAKEILKYLQEDSGN